MIGADMHDTSHSAHDQHVEPFDAIHLLMHNWAPRMTRPSEHDLETAWAARFTDTAATTPKKHHQSIHDAWSPSLDTPQTAGISSIDQKLNKVSMTSPSMLFSGTPQQSLLSDITTDEDPASQQPAPIIGFTTGGGKKIKSPSKDALEKSKNIMFDLGFTTGSGKKIEPPKEPALADLLFSNESPKRKLSVVSETQPIVKASRLHASVSFSDEKALFNWENGLKFVPYNELDDVLSFGVPKAVCSLNSESSTEFCFSQIDLQPWDVGSAYEDLQCVNGVKKELLSFDWVKNHYRWIVWKLASLARRFPKQRLPSFAPDQVLRQLYCRYKAEMVDCKRSALKKIAERDDVPGKPLILLIAKVFGDSECEVSDGWYSMKATLDAPLSALIKKRRLREGFKIITSGATLSAGEAVPILEAINASVRLHLNMNGTRLAKWHSKLGYYKHQFLIKSVRSDGGRIAGIEVEILRKYPQFYAIEDATGNRQVYNQREYDLLMDKFGSSPGPSNPVSALFVNSRTTTFIRLLLNINTILTVWSPDMVQDIEEGDMVRVFGATPSTGKNTNNGILSLNTTKGSMIVKVRKGKSPRHIYTEFPDKDNLPKELDITCSISDLPDEANSRSMSIFVEDAKESEMCILVPKRYFETFPKVAIDQKITFFDLLFLHYDRQKMIPVYTFTERSNFSTRFKKL
jgi:hypothetical protein